jgi:hypothetical protein
MNEKGMDPIFTATFCIDEYKFIRNWLKSNCLDSYKRIKNLTQMIAYISQKFG